MMTALRVVYCTFGSPPMPLLDTFGAGSPVIEYVEVQAFSNGKLTGVQRISESEARARFGARVDRPEATNLARAHQRPPPPPTTR